MPNSVKIVLMIALLSACSLKSKKTKSTSSSSNEINAEDALKISFVEGCTRLSDSSLPTTIKGGFSWLVNSVGYDESDGFIAQYDSNYCAKVESRLANIESLSFDGSESAILPWIGVFKKVKELSISQLPQDADTTPLKQLGQVESLLITESPKAQLGFIEAMPLQILEADLASLPKLTSLSKLSKLKSVILDNSDSKAISVDLSPLEKLSLESFAVLKTIENASFVSLTGIEKLPKTLKNLNFSGAKITAANFSSFNRFTQVETIAVGSGELTDISPIKGLNSLKTLSLSDCKVTDLSVLTNPNLDLLNITNTPIQSISSLKGLAKLNTLSLIGTNISELKGIESLSKITTLYLEKNKLTSLKGLDSLSALNRLDLIGEETLIDANALAPISNLGQLKGLGIQGIKGPSLQPLAKLNELRLFYFGDSTVSDLQFMSGLKKLAIVYLYRLPNLIDLKMLAAGSYYYLSLNELGAKNFTAFSSYKEMASLPQEDREWVTKTYGEDTLLDEPYLSIYLASGVNISAEACPEENVSKLLANACTNVLDNLTQNP